MIESTISKQMQREQIRDLYASTIPGVLLTVCTIPLIAYILYSDVPTVSVIVWAVALHVTSALRLVLYIIYRRVKPKGDLTLWLAAYGVALVLMGATWSLVPWTVFPHYDHNIRVVMTAVMFIGPCLTMFGTVSVYPVTIAYSVPILAPLAVWWALQSDRGFFYALLILPAWAFLVIYMKRVNHALTESRRLGMELAVARDQAEAANAAKSEFLATVSHEIRTPMNGILGMARLLMQASISKEAKNKVEVIQTSGNALLTLLNDILDLSKIEAGHLILENKPFNPQDIVQHVAALTEHRVREKGINFAVNYTSELPPSLIGDAGRIQQVLLNLVNNAEKFTNQGRIELTISHQLQGRKACVLRMEVSDTGVGIPPEARASIFEKFTQADTSTTRAVGGTGLGLSICAQLVGLMDGDISFESVHGAGTRFWFTVRCPLAEQSALPREEPSPKTVTVIKPAPRTASASVSAGVEAEITCRSKILVVEDNPVNQMVATEMLKSMGYETALADNGIEALQALKNEQYAAILLDMRMPKLDGIETTKAIRALPGPERAVAIIGVTANAMAIDRQRCLDAGMNAHISKPIDMAVLQETVQRYVLPTQNESSTSVEDESYKFKSHG